MPGGFGGGDGKGLAGQPITVSFGLLVLAALGVLAVLRYFYGAIRIEGGVR